MIVKISDWCFDVDVAFNMEYSALEAKDHCMCLYCRNFYAAVDYAYPDLRTWLTEFGVDVEAPEELIPHTPTLYDIAYRVKGEILRCGYGPIWVNEGCAEIQVDDSVDDVFWISFSNMVFPWILRETPDAVNSDQEASTDLPENFTGIDGYIFS